MTEAEWLGCDDPQAMLAFLRESGRASGPVVRPLPLATRRRAAYTGGQPETPARRNAMRAALVGLCFIALLPPLDLSEQARATTPAPPPALGARQWEYKTTRDVTDEELNKLGEEGWELTATTTDTMRRPTVKLYFKRPKTGARRPE
jgi:hypothetical protein